MNTHGLEIITLIRVQNVALFLMHHVPVLWIITIIIIMLDYHVAALNVLCFCLTLNGRMFEGARHSKCLLDTIMRAKRKNVRAS